MNQFNNMNKEQFDALVQAEVEKLLASRQQADAHSAMEQALTEAEQIFETLKASIVEKDAKIKEYETTLATLDQDPTTAEVAANDKIVELESSLASWQRRAEVAEAALTAIAREETAAARMSELTDAGVALENEAAEVQYSKVRAMSDEDFESYKNELVALKAMYAPASAEAEETDAEVATLSAEEVSLLAQSIGCDPSDSKCIALVQEVAAKIPDFFMKKKGKKGGKPPFPPKEECETEKSDTPADSSKAENTETASTKLSLGEAISRSMDQNVEVSSGLKEQLAQLWNERYAEKHGEKK